MPPAHSMSASPQADAPHSRRRPHGFPGQRQDHAAQPPAARCRVSATCGGRRRGRQRVRRGRRRSPPRCAPRRGQIALVEGGCIRCTASGGAADALRDLFMAALRRQRRAFATCWSRPRARARRLGADVHAAPRSLPRRALRLSRRDRGGRRAAPAAPIARAARGRAAARAGRPDRLQQGRPVLAGRTRRGANARRPASTRARRPACCRPRGPLPAMPGRLPARRARRCGGGPGHVAGRLPPPGRRAGGRTEHPGVSHFVLDLPGPVSRAAFLAGLDGVLARHGDAVLRGRLVASTATPRPARCMPSIVSAIRRSRWTALAGRRAAEAAWRSSCAGPIPRPCAPTPSGPWAVRLGRREPSRWRRLRGWNNLFSFPARMRVY